MYEFGRIHYDQLECTKRNKVEAESRRDGQLDSCCRELMGNYRSRWWYTRYWMNVLKDGWRIIVRAFPGLTALKETYASIVMQVTYAKEPVFAFLYVPMSMKLHADCIPQNIKH